MKREKSVALPVESRSDVPRRKRSRKEDPLGWFENLVVKRRRRRRRRRNGLNSKGKELENVESNSVLELSKEKEKGSLSLGDGVVMPKRPRGVSRQQKLDIVDGDGTEIEKDGNGCSTKSVAEVRMNDLFASEACPSQVSKSKKKKSFNVRKRKSRSAIDGSIHCSEGEKKTRSEVKSLLPLVKEDPLENVTTLVDNSGKFFNDDLDDDLEQNAARLLSSRFDPSCTGFSGSVASASSKCGRGLHGNSKSSEFASTDADGVMLRLRKRNGKSLVRKRRHFYEVSYNDLDPCYLIKQRIRVFWPLDKSWYAGIVKEYDSRTGLHHVKYDDGDDEWIDPQNERFKLLLFPSDVSGKYSSVNCRSKTYQMERAVDVNALVESNLDNCIESEPIISWLTRSKHRKKLTSTNRLKKERQLSIVGSVNILASIANSAAALENFDVFDSSMKVKQVTVKLSLQKLCIYEFAFGSESSLCHALFLLQFGKLVRMWPAVNMEIVIVDNVLGLKLILFDGSLKSAAAILCLFITSFYLYSQLSKFGGWQMPFTSIGINLSGLSAQGGKLLFSLYGFSQMEGPKWRFIEDKLKHHCVTRSEIPMVKFTSLNLQNIENGSGLMLHTSIKNALSLEKFPPILETMFGVVPNKALYSNMNPTSCFLNEKRGRLPSLPCSSSPLLLLSLHIKSLIESNASSVIFKNHHLTSSQEFPNAHGKFSINGCSPIVYPSAQISDISLEYTGSSLGEVDIGHLKVDTDSLSISKDGAWIGPINGFLSNKVFNATEVELNGNDEYIPIHNDADKSSSSFPDGYSSPKISEGGDNSYMNNTNCRIEMNEYPLDSRCTISDFSLEYTGSSLGEVDIGHLKVDTDSLSISKDGAWIGPTNGFLSNKVINATEVELNGNDEYIPIHNDADKSSSSFPDGYSSPKISEGGDNSYMNNTNCRIEMNEYPLDSRCTISPRSVQDCNGHNTLLSPTFGHCSKMWRDDLIHNGFSSGSKKPRTQVSYSLPFGGYDLGSKRRSHHRKPRSSINFNADSAKRMLGISVNSPSFRGLLSCTANVLITDREKGWREYGAQVGIESDDQKEWKICVKFSGFTKYAYKAQHIFHPGITNRHTHAMMWKGGMDWALEFTDRSQWSLFKEIHEECYSRSMRAAYVKIIPIPGVRLIADDDNDDSFGVPFVRSSSKYYRQIGNEVDMALDPAHVLYDMDSDDEKWVLEMRNSKDGMCEIADDMFERVMDIFEKFSYSQQCDEFSSDEIEEFMAEAGPVDVVKSIYDHWRLKRMRKGIPLIRQFQPPLWEQYHGQHQLKKVKSSMGKLNGSAGGSQDQAGQLMKQPMFAFCLRHRGLDVPNKGLKQRSHKKFMSTGGHGSFIARNQDRFHSSGGRKNGLAVGEGRTIHSSSSYESSDSYNSNDGSERYQQPQMYRSDPRNGTTLQSANRQKMPFPNIKRPKRTGRNPWESNSLESLRENQIQHDGNIRYQVTIDEFKLLDASKAALHASNMAKMRREKAEWLRHKAELAIHKASVALIIAEAIAESKNETIGKKNS